MRHSRCWQPLLLLSALLPLLLLPALLPLVESAKATEHPFDKFHTSSGSQFLHSKSFFSGGEDSVSWDEDELNHIRTVHDKKFNDEAEYMGSFHLGEYLGLHMVEAMHMPIPLNLIFVGFSADGGMGLNVTKEQLIEWFEHIDHVLPHTRISLQDISCIEDGHCSVFAKAEAPAPLHSYVHLNFSCHVVDLDSRPVLQSFERAIGAFGRPVHPREEAGAQQVDAVKMETFVSNFIKALGLWEQYSVVVVNPRWSPSRPKYGYRVGASSAELSFLMEPRAADRIMGLKSKVAGMKEPEQRPLWSHSWDAPWTYPKQAGEKFSIHDAQWTADHWVKSAAEWLEAEEKHRADLLKLVGGETGAAAMAQVLRVIAHPEARETAPLMEAALLVNPEHERHKRQLATSSPAEDCLVHSWVGAGRWLMVDLGAGGFTWGPALGGEGIVHRNTLPSVFDYFHMIDTLKLSKAAERHVEEQKQLEAHLERIKAERLGSLANRHYHAFFRQHQEQAAALAPGERTMPGDSLQTKWERHQQQLLLQAELDVVEEFALRHCQRRTNPPLVCLEAKKRADELQHSLTAVTTTTGAVPQISKEHKWDIFGHEDHDDIDPSIFTETMRQHDLFLARLTAVVSNGIRHVIAPPTATWHHDGYMHDTATPYAIQVDFELFVITDTSRQAPIVTGPAAQFDLEAFKSQIMTLKLQQQHFNFVTRTLSMHDDAQLASAFASSLHTTFQQLPVSKSGVYEFEHVYLDSHDLAAALSAQFASTPRRGPARSHQQLHVPVFIFLLDRDHPVLIDQHYNARALENLVLIVANAAKQDEHPLGFTCDGKLQSRPLSPLKDALAAMLQHLGGVLPPHFGYRAYTKEVALDWSWSVGAHPFSATSTGTKYTALQRDALFRSYLLDALDTSIDRVNHGLLVLSKEAPQKGVFRAIRAHETELRSVMEMYTQLVHLWHTTITHVQQLGFSAAAERIPLLLHLSQRFQDQCQEVHRLLHPHNCRGKMLPGGWARWLVPPVVLSSIVILVAGAYIVYTTHAIVKPKVS